MDYRAVVLLGFFVFGLAIAWILVHRRGIQPRSDRTGDIRGTAWIQVEFPYTVIALIFIAFDMEMIYMFPWAVAYREVGAVALWDMFMFAAILFVGLLYAWKRGAFHL